MNGKREKAQELFEDGYSCAQAVLGAYCEEYDLDTELALKMTCGFAAGCRVGELCGAVSGGVAVVGLKYGQHIEGDSGAKANCFARTNQFLEIFRERHGAISCRDLLGKDPGKMISFGGYGELCSEYVESAAEILEELGY